MSYNFDFAGWSLDLDPHLQYLAQPFAIIWISPRNWTLNWEKWLICYENIILYVDDFLGGTNSVKKAKEIYQELREIMRKGGFNLRKWNSNSKEVLQAINASEKPPREEKFKPAKVTQED